jgi:hypothetical protein
MNEDMQSGTMHEVLEQAVNEGLCDLYAVAEAMDITGFEEGD